MKYPYIQLWGAFLGSEKSYIKGQQELAERENAPDDAIFRRHGGTWATFDKLSSYTKQLVLEQNKEAQSGL